MGKPTFHNCVQSSFCPTHLAIGVSHVTPLLWKPHLCFQHVALAGSSLMPFALLLFHHAVVLHSMTVRNAFIAGKNCPVITNPWHRFPNFSAQKSPNDAKPIYFHLDFITRTVLALHVIHSSPRSIFGSETQAQHLCLPIPYHARNGNGPIPIHTAVKHNAEHMTDHSLALSLQWNTPWTVNINVAPPTSNSFAQCLFHSLCTFPFTIETISQHIGDFRENRSHSLPRPATLGVNLSSSSYEHVHHNDSGKGFISKSNNSSMTSFTIWTNISRSWKKTVIVGPHHAPQYTLIANFSSER